jgi:monomeric sarcosine oxidase
VGGATAPDVVVVGAGVFGAWTAWHLTRSGRRVVLLDQYGPANARSSSGGESRVIRMGYGADRIYTELSLRSLAAWTVFGEETGHGMLRRTGVLWLAREGHRLTLDTLDTLASAGVPHERLSREELAGRFPQAAFEPDHWGVLEPESGVLLARRAVQAVVADAVRRGCSSRLDLALPPSGPGRRARVRTAGGDTLSAGAFVFACGSWLPRCFPGLLGARIFPTRQDVFFFGTPPGDPRFAPPRMPAWIDFGEEIYGIPDLEGRGFKVAPDRHGPPFDPDRGERVVSEAAVGRVRAFLARRFPALAEAPLVESRVCQYENTSSGDFLVDRHPDFDDVWLVGGGSGHGFKHGPAVGEMVADLLLRGGASEPRFRLDAKKTVQDRSVF